MGESAPVSGLFLLCTDGVISGRRRGVFDRLRIGVRGVPRGVVLGGLPLLFPTGVAVEERREVFVKDCSDDLLL